MSVHISSIIWKVVMPNAGRKLVAVALADMANDDGSCWPSLRTLSARCNLSEDSIRNHLHALEAIGILTTSPRFQDGRQTSNVYAFSPDIVTGKALHLEWGRVESAPPLENREGGKNQEGEGGKKPEGGGGEKLPPQEPSEGTIIKPSSTADLVLKPEKPKKEPKENKAKCTLEEAKAFAKELGLPESDGESCFHKWEGNGWKNGTNSIKDWKATIRSWKAAGFLPSQKQPKFQQQKRTPTSCL